MSNPANEDGAPANEDADTSADSGPGISDEQLPEDLQPTDDNPLAKPPGENDDEDGGINPGTGDLPPTGP